MKKILSGIMILIGTMLLFAALFLVIFNVNEDKKGSETSKERLEQLKNVIISREPATEESSESHSQNSLFNEYEEETVPEEVLIEIDSDNYIGFISIPSLDIELPVMSEWSYPNLKLSPCRYKGTVAGGDLIIAAHNYRSHFGKIDQLNSGDPIFFTDGNGVQHEYELIQTETIEGRNIEAMDFGSGDSWDLTLFTCTLGGQSRVTVRAVEIEN